MADPIKIALAGIGKIARDQHLPSLEKSSAFELSAAISRNATVDGVKNYKSFGAFLDDRGAIGAVSLCTPPAARLEMAKSAIDAGLHVMLEKPPAATLSEADMLIARARDKGVVLFATWHSRYAPAVATAKTWLADKMVENVRIVWKEDVRRWHPGQAWIWEPGGFGVFDPGINALSIATEILPQHLFVTAANLAFPENRHQPVAAHVDLATASGGTGTLELDWLQEGPQTWDITIKTSQGTLVLRLGGAELEIDGDKRDCGPEAEYDGLYARFAELVARGESDTDMRPLQLVADAFLCGKHDTVAAFHD